MSQARALAIAVDALARIEAVLTGDVEVRWVLVSGLVVSAIVRLLSARNGHHWSTGLYVVLAQLGYALSRLDGKERSYATSCWLPAHAHRPRLLSERAPRLLCWDER